MRNRGHDVHIVCGKSLPVLATYEVMDGIHVHRTAWFGRSRVGWFLYEGWPVFKLLAVAKGADIMSPGIVEADPGIRVGDLVVVTDQVHNKPLAVGRALVNGDEMVGNKGKAIKSIHYVGDRIWNLEL